ncbi:UvrABC system protein A [Geodia barretti]|uniref:UvrABC system protein A n=1 Tax=Geodia barretti TaxID=519541 RepID=A0AA35RIK6_GEOBA|nr:UvrABC system protein A [Geodia barretti]
MQPTLVVREACEHNLRAVSLDLPHESLVAFSGPSGSGKTSLVLDTIYAEARRRFLAALDQEVAGARCACPRPASSTA